MHTYTLTAITGRKASERRTITFMTVDWQPRVLAILGLSLLPAVMVGAMLWPLLGVMTIFSTITVMAGAVWLFMARTKDSRDSTRFQDLRDRSNSKRDLGQFFVAGHQIDPLQADSLTLRLTTTRRETSPTASEIPW